MPMKTTQTVAMSTHHDNLESSGDSTNGSDFGFTDDDEDYKEDHYDMDDDDYYPSYHDEDEDYEEFSGSGDGGQSIKLKFNVYLVNVEVFFFNILYKTIKIK